MGHAVYKCQSQSKTPGLQVKALFVIVLLITESAFAQEVCHSHYEEVVEAHHIVSATGMSHDALARAARDALDCYGTAWTRVTGWLYAEATKGLIGSGRYQEARGLANEFFDRYALTADSTSQARLYAQRAAAHYFLGDLQGTHLDYQQALRLGTTLPETYQLQRHPERVRRALDRATAIEERLSDNRFSVDLLHQRALLALESGEPSENSRAQLIEALCLAEDYAIQDLAHALTNDLIEICALQDQELAILFDRGQRVNPLLYILVTLGIVGILLTISGVIAHRTGLITPRRRLSIEAGWHSAPPLGDLTCTAQYHTRDLPETINPGNLRTIQINRSFYIVLPIIRYEPGWDL